MKPELGGDYTIQKGIYQISSIILIPASDDGYMHTYTCVCTHIHICMCIYIETIHVYTCVCKYVHTHFTKMEYFEP